MSSSAHIGDEPPPPYSESSNDSIPSHQRQQPPHPTTDQPSLSRPTQLSTFAISIKPNTRPSEIPYPSEWASIHHVSPQDWDTFVGRLIPESVPQDSKCLSYERKRAIETVIQEWNETYFEPRGVKITFDEYSHSQPGGQSNSGASSSTALSPTGHPGPSSGPQSQRPPQPFPDQLPPRPSGQPSRKYISTRQKLTNKLKQVAQENDITYSPQHFRVGQMFTVDTKKIQIGRLNVDDRGVQYGGRPIGPQFPPGYIGQAMNPQNRPSQMHGYGQNGPSNASGYQYGAQPQGTGLRTASRIRVPGRLRLHPSKQEHMVHIRDNPLSLKWADSGRHKDLHLPRPEQPLDETQCPI
ncbi:unnamed protein product [Clonostachys rosea f. rosea IK726]|uniref:Uncharacterized protein n=1 Tax=Clonostachys rosea f. rosea IK726 TaxID=1349383 RepID=A0ACA9TTH2_BIOOC|nr:unnamed protein product [Clonostachys rosea f. rosea IK726]